MTSFLRFLISKRFWKNIGLMLLLTVTGLVGLFFWLLHYTRHDEKITVPDLTGVKIAKAERILREKGLRLQIIDTLAFDPDIPPYAVREQNPSPQTYVKPGRTVYVKINSAHYRKVTLPKLRGITVRQAKAMLHSLGLKVGKTEKKPYFAEVVLDIIHNRDTLRSGDKIPRNSVITLVVGSGEQAFDSESVRDSILANDSLQTGKTPPVNE